MSNSRDLLVLQVSAEELRLAYARVAEGRVELSHPASFWSNAKSGDSSALRDQTALDGLAAYVKERGWIGHEVICLLSGSSVACCHFDFPPLRDAALRQAVTLKLGQQLHFDVAQAVVATQSAGLSAFGDGKQIRVNVTAAEQELVNAALNAASFAQLNLKALSATPAAIAALASELQTDSQGHQAWLHLDEKVSTLVVLFGAVPFVTCELPMGSADFTAALMRPIISGDNVVQLDTVTATALRNEIGIPSADQEIASLQMTGERLLPLLEPVLQKLCKQITQWLAYAATCNGNVPIRALGLIGPGATLAGLADTIKERLGIDVSAAACLEDRATAGESMDNASLETFAPAITATKCWSKLPDLIPSPIRRQQRLARIRRCVTAGGLTAAAAILAFGIFLDATGRDARVALGGVNIKRAALDSLLAQNNKLAARRGLAQRLSGEIEEFVRNTPTWVGVFKELSLMLPIELKALEYSGSPSETGFDLIVKAGVHPDRSGRSFDEIVAQTVLLLQRSSFFKRVEMSANRGQQTEDPRSAGIVSIQLDLAFRKSTAKV